MQHADLPHDRRSTNSTAVRLLQATAELLGGEEQLAAHLGITESLLGRLMLGRYSVPDPLLLQAVDILLAHQQLQIPLAVSADLAGTA